MKYKLSFCRMTLGLLSFKEYRLSPKNLEGKFLTVSIHTNKIQSHYCILNNIHKNIIPLLITTVFSLIKKK